MSTIKSSAEHLTLNADGAGKEVKIQRNGTQVMATTSSGIDVTGSVTATRIGTGTVATLKNSGGHGYQLDIPSSSKLQLASAQGGKTLDLWANELTFSAGGSERMRIDSAGRVTMPNQPAFSVYATNQSYPSNLIQLAALDQIEFDIGSNFNTSTKRFTAPVSGRYLFTGSVQYSGVGSAHINFRVNGATVNSGWVDGYDAASATQSRVFDLNQHEYVDMVMYHNLVGTTNGNRTRMTGYLIG